MNTLNSESQKEIKFNQNYNRIFILWLYVIIWSGAVFLLLNLILGPIHQYIFGSQPWGTPIWTLEHGSYAQAQNLFYTLYELLFQLVLISRYFCAFLVLLTVITINLDSKNQIVNLKISRFYKIIILIVFWFSLFIVEDIIYSSYFTPLNILDILIGVFLTNFFLKSSDLEIRDKFKKIKQIVYIFCIIGLLLSFITIFFPGPDSYTLSLYTTIIVIIVGLSFIIIGIVLKFNLKLQWNEPV